MKKIILTLLLLCSNLFSNDLYDEEKNWKSSNDNVQQCKFDGPWYGQKVIDGKVENANWDLPGNSFHIKKNNSRVYASQISSSLHEIGFKSTGVGHYLCTWSDIGEEQMCSGTSGLQMIFYANAWSGLVMYIDVDDVRIAYRKFTCSHR